MSTVIADAVVTPVATVALPETQRGVEVVVGDGVQKRGKRQEQKIR